jgi:hypothetical protein
MISGFSALLLMFISSFCSSSDATQAVANHVASMVYATPQLDLIDYKCMDCTGLPANMSACCLEAGGRCSTASGFTAQGAVIPYGGFFGTS